MYLYTSIVNEVELVNSLQGFILIRLVNLKLFCHKAAPIVTSSTIVILHVDLHVACIHATVELEVKVSHGATDSDLNRDNYAAKTSTSLRLK